ncbi:MAG TPA: alpha/beta hydrolase [Chthoniobacterales bacterium]|jgi:acetyl esterase/lipase|nr:alpha/beta hydrolase [Chthoniobacterales bacterium]
MQTNRLLLFIVLLLSQGASQSEAQRQQPGGERGAGPQRQKLDDKATRYATADDGTPLKWNVFPGAGPAPHPAVLVIHGGDFKAEPTSPNSVRAARDAAAAGFNVFLTRYRLAPPGRLPGQKSLGQFPDQTNDLKRAVQAARAYPGGNGKVGAIGGSAGASHAVYLAATGTKGDDRLDAAVGLSGVYDLTLLPRRHQQRLVENYTGSGSIEAARKASPINSVDASVSPLYVIASDNESMPPNQLPALVRKLKEVGATNFKELLRTNSQRHAFANWPDVREQALDFLKQTLGTPGGGTGSSESNSPAPSPSASR